MIRTFLAAAVAFALLGSTPAFACPDCKDCPMHKDKVAAADKAEKKAEKQCKCGAKSAKDCKCGDKCDCHAAKKAQKDTTKST